MKIFLVILFLTSSAFAKVCTLDEIRKLDTQALGSQYSSYPMMTKATMFAPLAAYVPRMDSSGGESTAFSTVSFVGLAGWVYFGLQGFSKAGCEDDSSASRRRYRPTSEELIRYNRQQRDIFWKNYYWLSAWMLGVLSTTEFAERKIGAVAALAVPWPFAFTGRWSAFADESEFQYAIYPETLHLNRDEQTTTYNAAIAFSF